MADITTQYMGMTLRNPVIASSSGLSSTVDGVVRLEQHGAGAVVLKSIFEEEISADAREMLREALWQGSSKEAVDYLDYQVRSDTLDNYKRLIAESKKRVRIPVIASVNCTYSHEWIDFALELAAAGADALELNMFFLPTDMRRTPEEQSHAYFEIITRVRKEITLPIALKISPYFTDLGPMIQRLSETGINGLVLFNRFWSPDFDIEKMRLVAGNYFSLPGESTLPLRWVAIMAGRVKCDLVASTGIHDATAAIKQILAGAKAVQIASTLYRNGTARLQEMADGISSWMDAHHYQNIEQIRGKLSQSASADPAAYERAQFMHYYRGVSQTPQGTATAGALNGTTT